MNALGSAPASLFNFGIGQAAERDSKRLTVVPFILFFFLVGWVTDGFSLKDIGPYSIPLIYIAALPFCIRTSSRSLAFLALTIVSTIFSILVASLEGADKAHIVSQATLQVLAIFFAAGVASIDWTRSMVTLTKVLVIVAAPVVAYGGYQMVARASHLPYAFLRVTNQQAYADGGLQRGWDKASITRASSLFVEPSDFGYFCLWLFVLGLSLERGRLRYSALALAFFGILFSQSLSAVLGVGIVLLIYLFTNPVNFKVVRQILLVLALLGLAIAAIEPFMPEAFASFSDRIQQAVSLDQRADSGRIDHLPACWEIFKESPVWGRGLSSVADADANGSDTTTIMYALLLMERGLLGTLFFFAPWIYIGVRAFFLPRSDAARKPALLLTALHLYSFSTFSMSYFLPFWLSLGITGSLVLHTHIAPKRLALAGWSGHD